MSGDQRERLLMSEFDYELPPELIAQTPLPDRSASRLLCLNRSTETLHDRTFSELPELLDSRDLLVFNDSRVIPARLLGRRETGGRAEALLLRKRSDGTWLSLVRPAKRLTPGQKLIVPSRHDAMPEEHVEIVSKEAQGQAIVRLAPALEANLPQYGRVPLPPYIRDTLEEDERYQTVYSRDPGSAAAPTAGLHFSEEVFTRLEAHGIKTTFVTLHVGLDTFRPVSVQFADEHLIHQEWCHISRKALAAIRNARAVGGRVIAVGTTSARTLESLGALVDNPALSEFSDMTGIYITPGYQWRVVDAMVTNFHLPRSTLLLMLSSFVGKDLLFKAYEHAIAERYRFFSFGDAMFIT